MNDGEQDVLMAKPVGCAVSILTAWWLPAVVGAVIELAVMFLA